MLKKLVIASNNQGKLREIGQLLAPLNIEIIAQSALNIAEADEPHCTFIENALAKARHASKQSGLPALADDSGICLEALDGAPGVQSAYFAGKPSNDANNNAHMLKMLKEHGNGNRFAHYYCCIVLVRRHHDPQPLIAEGIWQGAILKKPRGENGFGYDPIFMDSKTGKSGAELPVEIKNKISHRGQAMRKMLLLIENLAKD